MCTLCKVVCGVLSELCLMVRGQGIVRGCTWARMWTSMFTVALVQEVEDDMNHEPEKVQVLSSHLLCQSVLGQDPDSRLASSICEASVRMRECLGVTCFEGEWSHKSSKCSLVLFKCDSYQIPKNNFWGVTLYATDTSKHKSLQAHEWMLYLQLTTISQNVLKSSTAVAEGGQWLGGAVNSLWPMKHTQ